MSALFRSSRLPAALLVMAWCCCGVAADDPVLLEIGAEQVRLSDFEGYYRQVRPQADFGALPAEVQRNELDEYIERRLLAAHARALDIDQEPEVRHRIDFFSNSVLAEAMRKHVINAISVSEQEMQQFYKNNQQEFWTEPRLFLEHLIFRDEFSAATAREQLSAGESYAALVSEEKRDPDLVYSRRGWLTPPLLIVELRDTVVALGAGEITPILRSNYGHHVLRLVEKEPGYFRPFSDVQNQVKEKVQREKAATQHAKLLQELRGRTEVRSHLDQLRAIGAF